MGWTRENRLQDEEYSPCLYEYLFCTIGCAGGRGCPNIGSQLFQCMMIRIDGHPAEGTGGVHGVLTGRHCMIASIHVLWVWISKVHSHIVRLAG